MKTIRVWDPVVRILHWALVFCVIGNLLNESGETVHRFLGYTACIVVGLRIVWGFVGTRHARFSDWFPTPARLFPYLKAILHNRPSAYVGHNPVGAVMMLAMMLVVLSLGATGWLMGTDTFFGEEWVEDLHEGLADALMVMVALHVSAAIFESWVYKVNLFAAMVHGRKAFPSDDQA